MSHNLQVVFELLPASESIENQLYTETQQLYYVRSNTEGPAVIKQNPNRKNGSLV